MNKQELLDKVSKLTEVQLAEVAAKDWSEDMKVQAREFINAAHQAMVKKINMVR